MSVTRTWIIATLLTMAGGCADDYNSVVIIQNQAITDDCLVSGAINNAARPHGTLDIAEAEAYVMTPVMQSALVDDNVSLNSNIITMQGANVTLLPVNNEVSKNAVQAVRSMGLDKLNSRFAGSLFPGSTLGATFNILDPAQVEILKPIVEGQNIEVTARVVVYGDVEGERIESKPFDYPITLCSGCLSKSLGACSSLDSGFTGVADPGAGCFPGQDGKVQCCSEGATLVCPAQGTRVDP